MALTPETEITEQINVTRQQLVVAKAFLVTYFDKETCFQEVAAAVDEFLTEEVNAVALQATQPIGQQEWTPSLTKISEAISWRLASYEAPIGWIALESIAIENIG